MRKAVILDRDGVINYDSLYYIKSIEEFKPIPGSLEAMARLTQAGFMIGIATNQSGVARKLYTREMLEAIHGKLLFLAREKGAEIQAIEYCLHMPDAGCQCRKPAPGMLEALAKKLHLDSLEHIPFVGDRVSDIQAALAAQAWPFMVLSPMTDLEGLSAYPDVPVFSSLSDWVNFWLQRFVSND